MKGFGKQKKFNKKMKSDFKINQSNTQLLNQALIFQSKGNISEAKKYYKYWYSYQIVICIEIIHYPHYLK